ncbi:hypothetical protein pipiens_016933, partial [Culex pipiens pipiens]
MPSIDMSHFLILTQEDGSVTMNGTVRFTKDYESPKRWKVYTERLERGEWHPAIIARDIPNICAVLQMPHEPWYRYTKFMEQKSCPYLAG